MVDGPRGKRGLAVILASGPLSPWRMDFLGIPVLQRMGLDVIHFDGDRLLRPNCEEKGRVMELISIFLSFANSSVYGAPYMSFRVMICQMIGSSPSATL